MLAYYDQTRYEDADNSILEKDPIVKMWEEAKPYLLEFNSYYQGLLNNIYYAPYCQNCGSI